MNNLTFLEIEKIIGPNKLDIFNKRGTAAAMTDFSILLGGFVGDDDECGYDGCFYFQNSCHLFDRTGSYWTRTAHDDGDVCVVTRLGSGRTNFASTREFGIRPALPYSATSLISLHGVSNRARDGVLEVEYGYYPQYAISKDKSVELEAAYQEGTIQITGNVYTTDSLNCFEYKNGFLAQDHIEYEFEGKRYVRVIVNSYFKSADYYDVVMSNREKYKNGDPVWVEVSPVKWLVDEKEGIAVSKKIIVSGLQFDNELNYKGDFDKTNIKKFMDSFLVHDLFREETLTIGKVDVQLKKRLLYETNSQSKIRIK